MVTIDDLQIKISTDASDAAKGLRDFARGLRDTAADCSKAAKKMDEVAKSAKDVGQSTEKASDSTEKLEETAKETSKSFTSAGGLSAAVRAYAKELQNTSVETEKANGKFAQFLASIKRIVLYRAIRSAIKLITQALKEGINNLVNWDYAFGNNTSGAYQTMTELKSIAHQLVNSLGAMAMPIIQLVLPALRLLAQALMEIFNIINQAFRSLQGYGTYMKAVYKEVSAVEDSTKGAAKAAKELQRILFGFDELNILPSDNGRSRYGGTGALENIMPYEFQETDINLGSIGDFFSKGLSGIWSPFSAIIELLSGESPFKSIGDFFSQAWESIKTDFINGWETFKESLAPVTGWISQAWEDIKKAISDGWVGLKNTPIIGQIAQWLEDFFSGRMFTGTYWKGIWDGFKKDVVDPIAKFVKSLGKTIDLVVDYITHPKNWSKANWAEITSEINKLWNDSFDDIENRGDKLPQNLGSDFNKVLSLSEGSSRKLPFGWNNAFDLVSLKSGQSADTTKTNIASIGTTADETATGLKKSFDDQNAWFASHPLNPRMTTPTLNVQELQSDVTAALYQFDTFLANNPLSFLIRLATGGFAPSVANVYGKMQNALADAPLAVQIVSQGGAIGASTVLKKQQELASVRFYAEGGFPDVGTLFYAGEAGAEVVANTSHGTGVMNMSQMQEAVANGNIEVVNAIYAMANMITGAVNSKDFDIYMDSAKVGQSVTKYQFNQARRGITQGAY